MNPTDHTATLRTHPGAQAALFIPELALTADPDRYRTPGFVNIGVATISGEIRLILRSVLDTFAHPLDIAMPPNEADALSRSLRSHAVYTDPELARRPPP
ncbi:hypothetical protein [Pseudonocardia sp. GCM10023141]|uniref:hypothetical protein n=1 Tax=Pseudonocardia sp. GCM10023141 TaxID=3252653 RepID=UPI0036080845